MTEKRINKISDSVEEIANEKGVEEAIAAVFHYDGIETEKYIDAKDVVKEILPTTDGRGRRSMDYCLVCNPEWNGSYGKEGTEAIAKHKVKNYPGEDQFFTGWQGLCEKCARSFKNTNKKIQPLPGFEEHGLFDDSNEWNGVHDCENPTWEKFSLVTEDGGFDWVQCKECGLWGERWGTEVKEIGFEGNEIPK